MVTDLLCLRNFFLFARVRARVCVWVGRGGSLAISFTLQDLQVLKRQWRHQTNVISWLSW